MKLRSGKDKPEAAKSAVAEMESDQLVHFSEAPVGSASSIHNGALSVLEVRDCRNGRSPYHTLKACDRPPCIYHPSGTLKYQWHGAYDHLLSNSANRKNSHAVLMGYEHQSRFDSLAKFVMSYFDEDRKVFLSLELPSSEAKQPFRDLRQAFLEYIGKERGDPIWYLKDDPVYIELALTVFIKDSYRHWMRRSAQTGSVRKIEQVFEVAKGDNNSEPPVVEAQTQRQQRFQGQNSTPDNVSTSPTDIDIETSRDDINLSAGTVPATVQAENHHVKSAKHRLLAAQVTLENQVSSIQRALADTTVERDILRSDNAALGIALAECVRIRRNSKAAVVRNLAAKTSLTVDVTGRLMENEDFTRKWFPDYYL